MLGFLKAFSLLISKRMDAIMALAVMGIVFMMILPMPTWLVDILIAVNISISALLVVLALYLPGPLAFSTFPAFLLITTLFRLGLSITTTRLILLQGDAGQIVDAFGNFVVGGNLVVGVVIFLILLIVNFLVITKGSERVAEVSARFTLDAMPGKQMSIDSDLRGGLLTAKEAQTKRRSLSKESQLFGAMDGAMKFVKGDAIAGIIIVMVNIIGGYLIGTMQQGMAGGDAIQLYAILTIGDGLVAQIPAILIALSAGMIITRVKDDAGDTDNVGKEMSEQLTSEPRAWIIAALVLTFFSAIPGMPTFSFLALSLLFVSVGGGKIFVSSQDKKVSKSIAEEQLVESGKSDVASFDVYEPLTMFVNPELHGTQIFDLLKKTMRMQRNSLVADYGFILPPITYQIKTSIQKNLFQLRFYEVVEVNSTLDFDKIGVSNQYQGQVDSLGIEYQQGLKERKEDKLLWISTSDIATLDENNIVHDSSLNLIAVNTRDALKNKGYQFLGVDDAKRVITWVAAQSPELVRELERIMPVSKVGEILQNLVKESVSLRSLRKIVELIVKNGESERDIITLTEMVRIGLKEQLCSSIVNEGEVLNVCLFDPSFEDYLRERLRKTASGGFFEISEDEKNGLLTKIMECCEQYILARQPIALVVSPDLRPYVKNMLNIDFSNLTVLSYSELSDRIEVTAIDRISGD